MTTIEISAKTPEEAIEIALKELDVERGEVEIDVVSRGKSGILGLGSEPARVRVTVLDKPPDVVKVTASPMGFGGIKGAEAKGKYAIGTYMDLNRMAPDTILSSTLFIWHAAMKKIVLDMKKGKVKKQYLVNIPDGGAAMAPFNKKVPPKVAERVRAAQRDIKSGKLKVPFLGKKIMK